MAIFLDSADVADAECARQLGFVAGVTTNPKLLAGANPLARIPELLDAIPDVPVCCQLTELDDAKAFLAQGEALHALDPERVVIKVPTRTETLNLACQLIERGIPCAMTTIFSPEQALIAGEIGAAWVIPYVDRTTRLGGDGLELVSEMRRILDAIGARTRVMAGSIKSAAGVARIVEAGAHDVTASLDVVKELGNHEWSEASIADFAEAAQSGASK
ncbi:MAG: transaldolase [Acidobacteria bacterium]|nr:MAG: transaldolase [Acidobacteriota bacterium]